MKLGGCHDPFEQIEKQLNTLPPEKQCEALDFIAFLQQHVTVSQSTRPRSLKNMLLLVRGKVEKLTRLNISRTCALSGIIVVDKTF